MCPAGAPVSAGLGGGLVVSPEVLVPSARTLGEGARRSADAEGVVARMTSTLPQESDRKGGDGDKAPCAYVCPLPVQYITVHTQALRPVGPLGARGVGQV